MAPYDALAPYGWSGRWAALLTAHDGAEPARVLRHDGVAVEVRTPVGERTVPLRRGVEPVVVGDWLALDGDHVVAVLPRASLLRRRAAGSDGEQRLAANIDVVLLVCGLDRGVRDGRLQRGEALAWDAGAVPVAVLTKADAVPDAQAMADEVQRAHAALEVHLTSAATGDGIDELNARISASTTVLLGESGAGKSRLVNALAGADVAITGDVRAGDAKGRHTTTNRQLHVLPGGGIVIDTPGIREVGLAVSADAVDQAFTDIEDLAPACRFSDCAHGGEPGCAVAAAVDAGELTPERVERYHQLRAEAEAAELRADEHARRRHDRRFGRAAREAQRLKGRDD